MQESLEDRFPVELALLSRLFGGSDITTRLRRLNQVSEYTEEKWLEYVAGIRARPVKYLLIAEAPPETVDELPAALLPDPECRPRTLMRAVSSAFFGCRSIDGAVKLAALAERGFLMVDSIPFAVNYTSHRSRVAYSQLVARTARTYMSAKLVLSSLSWSDDLRIAFSVRLNARCVMSALKDVLQLGGREFTLSEDMIATNASNYHRRHNFAGGFPSETE